MKSNNLANVPVVEQLSLIQGNEGEVQMNLPLRPNGLSFEITDKLKHPNIIK